MRLSVLVLLLLAGSSPGTISAQSTASPSPRSLAPIEVLHGFTLIDGLGGPPVPDAALAIRGSLIVDAGPREAVLARSRDAPGRLTVDLGGGWVTPGLIDSHVHLATAPNRTRAEAELRRLLYAGVTSVRDMAGDARVLAALARDAELGEIVSPDIAYAALLAGPSFYEDPRPHSSSRGAVPGQAPWMQAVTDDMDLQTVVALARGTSATGLKVYADLDATAVGAIVSEATRQGMPVWAHGTVFPARPLEVVRAGVRVVSHACGLAWEGMAEVPTRYHDDAKPAYEAIAVDAAVFTELFGEMRDRGTILDATLAMYDTRASDFGAGDTEADTGRPGACRWDFARALVRRAHEAGVLISAGTDFTAPVEDGFPALYRELETLVSDAGLTPMDAIVAATRVGAVALGRDDTVGTLQPGMTATFLVLNADPSADIRNLRSIREVWKNADRFPRTGYYGPN